jgi:hypothetical protein
VRAVEDGANAPQNGWRRERGVMGGVDPIRVAYCVASRHVANKIVPCDGGFTKTVGAPVVLDRERAQCCNLHCISCQSCAPDF